jgi:inner membrane transporter RhtA
VSSSVIPYVTDQLAMARLSRSAYSLMVSLLPATATVIGVLVLSQVPSPRDVLGVGLVVLGVGLHREGSVISGASTGDDPSAPGPRSVPAGSST